MRNVGHVSGQSRRLLRVLVHPRLRTKLMIGVVLAACVASGLQFAISWDRVNDNLAAVEAKRMREDLNVARGALEQMQLQLERSTAGAAVSPDMARAAETGRKAWLEENITSHLRRTYSLTTVAVFNLDHRLVAEEGQHFPGLAVQPAVQTARMNVVKSNFAYENGRLWLIAAAPILPGEQAKANHGVLVMAQLTDATFASTLSTLIDNQVTFFAQGKVLAATDARLADALARPDRLDELMNGHGVVIAGGSASKGQYLGVDGSQGLMVVSNDRAPISSARRALQRSMLWSLLPSIALACFVAIILSIQLGRPLRSLRTAVNAIAFGDLSRRVKASGDDEIADLGRAFNSMADRVSLAQETLRRAAVRDSLTGLLNHREFYRRLTDEIARAEREQLPLSVLMIDLDNFKGINDNYGHLRGDTVLREVAGVITRSVREEDVVARYAGDEFSVILPGAVEADAVCIAERLRSGCEGVMQAVELADGDDVTLSIGVVTRRPGEYTSNYTVELADMALYRAKEAGRDRVEVAGENLLV